MANATNIPQKTLRVGVDEDLYVATGGAIQSSPGPLGTPPNGTFGLPPQSMNWRGQLLLEAVPVGGTVTALTGNLEISLDHGNTWATLVSAITFGALPSVQRVDVSGAGGNGTLRFNPSTVTLGTGTGANMYAHAG